MSQTFAQVRPFLVLSIFSIDSKFSLLRHPASIDDQRGPDGELWFVGTEIEDRSSDFFGNTFSANRNHRSNLIAQFTPRKTIKHFGCDHTWCDRIDANVLFGEFERDRFGQAFDGVLGSNVNADLPQTNVPGHAGIVDDGAASVLEHGRNFVTHRIENTPNVDVENAPILSFGSLIERAFPFNAGIVKCDVETAEFIDSEIDHRFDVGIFRDVRADERRIAAQFFNFANDLRAFLFAASSQSDLRPGSRECDRRGLADTGSSSGYECNFV